MIKGIALQTLRNAEFLQFLKQLAAIFTSHDPALLKVTDPFDAFIAAKASVDLLFNEDQASAITDELVALDAQRDDLINGMICIVQGHTYHFEQPMRKHALTLQTNIASYGSGIARENYLSETAILDKLNADWETKPELLPLWPCNWASGKHNWQRPIPPLMPNT